MWSTLNRRCIYLLFLSLWMVLAKCDTSSPQRTLHRLVGGHMRTQPELDDVELIITSSAGGGRESKTKESDDKKTLSQQVADGKYGLIQNELFGKPVKRPGIISYESNPEVPKDNINNLGGLTKNDIWLAENHLLVIRGGEFEDQDVPGRIDQPVWKPIDDFHAPGRQVKLPNNPKVPPPFPVQLVEDGPLQILGTNYSTTPNGTLAASPYPLPPPEDGFYPSYPQDGSPHQTNVTAGETPFSIPAFPPDFSTLTLNSSLPPFFASLPPGAAIAPPPNNTSIEYDDDDPSIYYPPPYSFYYQMDNSTQVPPGPLVPGIVLPPPPNFFAPLEKPRYKQAKTGSSTTRRPFTTAETLKPSKPTNLPIPLAANKPTRVKTDKHHIPPVHAHSPTLLPTGVVIRVEDTTIAHPIKEPHRIITIVPVKQYNIKQSQQDNKTNIVVKHKSETVTVLKPVKSVNLATTTPRPIYFYENNMKPYQIYGPPSRPRTTVTSTQIPLKQYYSTSNDIDNNYVVTQQPEIGYYTPKTTKSPRQYYYYEEQPHVNSITTHRTPKENYLNVPQEYYAPAKQAKPILQQPPPQYYYRPNRPPNRYRFVETTKKPDSFSIHVARLKQQIHHYYATTPEPYLKFEQQSHQQLPKPVYQFSFQAANYRTPQISDFRASPLDSSDNEKFQPINKYNVEIQPAIEVFPTRHTSQNTPTREVYRTKPIQILRTSTQKPLPTYYTTNEPDYNYEDVDVKQKSPSYKAATSKPISQYSYNVTPSPFQSYYTKAEDSYLDDLTQKYFTVFGKKITGQTTPIPPNNANTPRSNVQIQYAQSASKDISLHGDTIVNYVHTRPIEPQAEYIPPRRPQNVQIAPQQINANHEIVQAIPVNLSTSSDNKQGSFISYELPGDDGAHFYFLTPQLAQSRDQGAGFYFENPKAQELKDKQQQHRLKS